MFLHIRNSASYTRRIAFAMAMCALSSPATAEEQTVAYLPAGSSQWISTGVSLKGDARTHCTVESWVYQMNSSDIVRQYSGNTGRQNFGRISSSGHVYVQLLGYSGDNTIESDSVLPLNQWTHVAWVVDGGTWRLYLNGELDVEETGHDGQLLDEKSTDGLVIGNSRTSSPNGSANSYFAETRVWKCVRTGAEIKAAMNTRIADAWNIEDLIGYWPLNDGAAAYAANGNKARNYAVINSATYTPSGTASWNYSYASGSGVEWVTSDLPVTGSLGGDQSALYNMGCAKTYEPDAGKGNYTNAVNTLITDTPENFTFMGWYQVTIRSASRANYLFGKTKEANGRAQFYEQNGKFVFWMGGGFGGKTNESLVVENCMPFCRWAHVALTKRANEVRIYVNGALVGASNAFTLSLCDAALHVGGFDAGGSWGGFYGAFKNVGFWSKAMDAEYISRYMYGLPDPSDAKMLGYWPMDEGSGNSVRNLKPGAPAGVPLGNGFFYWTKGANMPTVAGTVKKDGMIIILK